MPEEEIAEIRPNFIILDEFQRCGAELWGAGVQRLLAAYAQVPVLGLSATAIRYLDNQRDMADELFDGNVASEMTLSEAIVRGILNPPKYVLSVFSYQKDPEKYQRKINRAKSKPVRDTAEKYLEALWQALEMADGLDDVFAKHMAGRSGKYLVFCANAEHMRETIGKVPDMSASMVSGWEHGSPCRFQSTRGFASDAEIPLRGRLPAGEVDFRAKGVLSEKAPDTGADCRFGVHWHGLGSREPMGDQLPPGGSVLPGP